MVGVTLSDTTTPPFNDRRTHIAMFAQPDFFGTVWRVGQLRGHSRFRFRAPARSAPRSGPRRNGHRHGARRATSGSRNDARRNSVRSVQCLTVPRRIPADLGGAGPGGTRRGACLADPDELGAECAAAERPPAELGRTRADPGEPPGRGGSRRSGPRRISARSVPIPAELGRSVFGGSRRTPVQSVESKQYYLLLSW